MAHINFLEEQRFGFRQFNLKDIELNYLFMMVILGVFLILMLGFGLIQRYRISGMNEELAAAIAELKKSSGAPMAKAGTPQALTLLGALSQRVVWSPILNAIANTTPDSVFLNFIKGSSMVNRGVQIEGVGADVLATVRYEDDLSMLPVFSKVFLKSSSEKSDKKAETKSTQPSRGVSGLTFEIQAWLR